MRGLKVTLVLGSCFALTGCSSVLSDISNFVSGKKSSQQTIATTNTTGSYIPATYGVDLSAVDCPAGTYLTADNTCMMQDTQSYQMQSAQNYQTPPLRGLSNPSVSYQTSSTFVTPTTFDLERFNNSLTGPLICPDGMILVGAYDCRFPDSASLTVSTPSFITNAKSYSYEYACPMGSYKDPDNVCMRSYPMP